MGKLIGLLVIVGGFLVWRRWRKLPSSRAKRKFVFQSIVVGLLLLVILLAMTGRIHYLGAVFAVLVVLLKIGLNLLIRWLPLFARLYGANFAKPRSLKTGILEIVINFANGEVSGKVIQGPHAGSALNDLSESQLQEVLSYCQQQDKKSAYLMQMYLARRFQHSSQSGNSSSSAPSGSMTKEEAAEILGVPINADKDEINQAHRRLIGRVHPDKGGNDYLASLLNRARDLLLE